MAAGENVLAAALAAGIPLPHSCRAGRCATCKARVLSGEIAYPDDKLPPAIHGEVGFTVGTGGYRSAYGTAIVPLKDDGVAIISLGTTDFGSRARYPAPWGW